MATHFNNFRIDFSKQLSSFNSTTSYPLFNLLDELLRHIHYLNYLMSCMDCIVAEVVTAPPFFILKVVGLDHHRTKLRVIINLLF